MLIRAWIVALLAALAGQEPGTLHIKVTLTDARGATPIAGAALLISDNPSTSAPRRVVTDADGTATVRLRAGNYTVESDDPVAFGGKGYSWIQTLDVRAGREATLELTAKNAEVGAAPAEPSASAGSASGANMSALLPDWQDSVVAVWSPASRASGFLVEPAGLVLTNQHVVGTAATVEVQLTASVKVAARVLAADRKRDAAVLWIDPAAASPARPIPLNCAAAAPPIADKQKLIALGAPLRGRKESSPGEVVLVGPDETVADFRLADGSLGGPVFAADGRLVGLSTVVEAKDARPGRDAAVVPVSDACEVMKAAEKAMQTTERPTAAHLPVEPPAMPAEALDAAVKRRQGSLNPYQTSSAGFDVAFLTPLQIRGGLERRSVDVGDWSDYFLETPTVLVIRATPKMTEKFWTTVARGAAYTQGVALPPIKHFQPGFARMQVLCGDVEVTPIHPFVINQRVSETDAIREGLYVFEPDALGPQCASVKIVLYSEKPGAKAETRVVEPTIVRQIADDLKALGR